MADKTLKVRYVGDASSLQKTTKAIGASNDSLNSKVQKTGNAILKSTLSWTGGLVAAGLAVKAFVVDSVKAAIDAQQSQLRLANAVANSTKVNAASIPVFQAQAQALRDVTGFDDDAINSFQALLVTMGLTQSQVTKLTPAILDLAAKGYDLNTAAKAVGKSVNGTVGGLAKMGVVVDKAKAKVDPFSATVKALSVNEGLAAERAKAEPWLLLQSAWQEMQETLGKALLPAIQKIVPSLVPIVGFIGTVLQPILDSLADTVDVVADGLDALGLKAKQSGDAAGDASKGPGLLKQAWDVLTTSGKDLFGTFEIGIKKGVSLSEAYREAKYGTDQLTSSTDQGTAAQIQNTIAHQKATQALKDQRTAQLALTDKMVALVSAIQAVRDAQVKYTAAVKDHGVKSKEAQQAAIDLFNAVSQQAGGFRDYAKTLRDSGATEREAEGRLTALGIKYGLNRATIKLLVDQLQIYWDKLKGINGTNVTTTVTTNYKTGRGTPPGRPHAEGGIVTRPQWLDTVAEAGPEAVIPLNSHGIDVLASALSRSGIAGGGNTTVVVRLDRQRFGRAAETAVITSGR